MSFLLLSADQVVQIHDLILNPGELPGLARDKSLDGALARVENRLAYGMIADVFDLAAGYAAAISQGHCFNDGNKRTAFRSMQMVLAANGATLPDAPVEDIGNRIIRLAQGHIDPADLAAWLRARAG